MKPKYKEVKKELVEKLSPEVKKLKDSNNRKRRALRKLEAQ